MLAQEQGDIRSAAIFFAVLNRILWRVIAYWDDKALMAVNLKDGKELFKFKELKHSGIYGFEWVGARN